MPERLSFRFTLLLVALAFGLTFAVLALLGGGASSGEPAAKASSAHVAAYAGRAEPDLRLASAPALPSLREPRRPHKRRKPVRAKKPPKPRVVQPAPRVFATPTATPTPTVQPTPAPTPRYVAPAPRPPAPRPQPVAPKPTPAPTAPPPSGDFDTSGE